MTNKKENLESTSDKRERILKDLEQENIELSAALDVMRDAQKHLEAQIKLLNRKLLAANKKLAKNR